MEQITHIYKIPIKMKIWKSREAYIGIIDDTASIEFLQPYIGKRIILEIMGVSMYAKVTKMKQKEDITYLAIFLPRRLAPTWDELRQKAELHNAVITITEGGGQ